MTDSFMIVAHRGAHLGVKKLENTLVAFQAAVGLQSAFIECDVQRTSDGVLICFHDDMYREQPVSFYSFEALQQLLWEENIALCTFQEYVALHPYIRLDIELKQSGYENEVWDCLEEVPLDRYVIKSFQIDAIRALRQISDVVSLGFLIEEVDWKAQIGTSEPTNVDILQWLRALQSELSLHFLSPEIVLVSEQLMSCTQEIGLEVWPWTIRTIEDMRKMQQLGIRTIVTDIPNVLSV
jgi:glycerophosphoryl diester phosphodiesterase